MIIVTLIHKEHFNNELTSIKCNNNDKLNHYTCSVKFNSYLTLITNNNQ